MPLKCLVAVLVFFLSVSVVSADSENFKSSAHILNPAEDPHLNVILGISPFVGIVGIEAQKKEHALAIGIPARIAYRYFPNPYGDTKFFGGYLGRYSIDDYDKGFEGVRYKEFETTYVGLGVGYRWQWKNGWNLNLSIALEYAKREYGNPGMFQSATEKIVYPFPGINVGYKF